jgi:2-keto-4-pentenoate hydratase/2-oxohepta-3-ene-1,7-dioic acid hydratase in catechol pathway
VLAVGPFRADALRGSMRLARVLIADAPTPQVALERDGSLYDVEALDERFDTRFAPERFANAGDFRTRAIALGCAGLDDLDARLCSGERPTEARLDKDAFVWCAPFDADRALLVELRGFGSDELPRYRIGNARSVVGHAATIALADDETRAEVKLDLGIVLREDLTRASAGEAREAILGLSILAAWTGQDELERARAAGRGDGAARDRASQLGPLLVTIDELASLRDKRAQLRIGDRVVFEGTIGTELETIAESIAALSHALDLRAGDLIGAGLDLARAEVPRGIKADLLVERLGRLTGRPTP